MENVMQSLLTAEMRLSLPRLRVGSEWCHLPPQCIRATKWWKHECINVCLLLASRCINSMTSVNDVTLLADLMSSELLRSRNWGGVFFVFVRGQELWVTTWMQHTHQVDVHSTAGHHTHKHTGSHQHGFGAVRKVKSTWQRATHTKETRMKL